MKKKWKYEVVNNQEDEEGYNLYPVSDINCESAKKKQNINSNKNTADTEPGSWKLTVVSMDAGQRISQRIFSPVAKQAAR